MAGAIFHSRLSHALPSAVSPSLDLEHLNLIQPSELRNLVLHAVSSSIQVCLDHLAVLHLILTTYHLLLREGHMGRLLPLYRGSLLGWCLYIHQAFCGSQIYNSTF